MDGIFLTLAFDPAQMALVCVVTRFGHSATISGGVDRTAMLLLADDCADLLDLIHEGDGEAADLAADLANVAAEAELSVTIDGRPLNAAGCLAACEAAEGTLCASCESIQVDLVLTADLENGAS